MLRSPHAIMYNINMVKIKTCLDPDIIDMYRKDKLTYRIAKRLSPVFNLQVSKPIKRFLAASLAAIVLVTGGVTLAKNMDPIELPTARALATKLLNKAPGCSDECRARIDAIAATPATAEAPAATAHEMPLDVFVSATSQEDASLNKHAKEAMGLTGVSAQYLMRVTHLESGGDLFAKNASSTTSSAGAAGFTDSTWLQTLKKHGPRFGYGAAADRIGTRVNDDKTVYYITTPIYEEYIMKKLRYDPRCVTMMSAALTVDNYYYLKDTLGPAVAITETDLYKAHFLGPYGAVRFHQELHENPKQTTADIFPAATNEVGNKNILGTMQNPKTIAEVHGILSQKMPPKAVMIPKPQI